MKGHCCNTGYQGPRNTCLSVFLRTRKERVLRMINDQQNLTPLIDAGFKTGVLFTGKINR